MHEVTHIQYGNGYITIEMNSESQMEIAAPVIRFGDYEQATKSCFSEKELSEIFDGENANVTIDICMSDEIDNDGMKTGFEQTIMQSETEVGTLHEGVYIDVEATKNVGNSEEVSFDTLYDDVEMQLDIPRFLAREGRRYYALTDLKGAFELKKDIDEDADTLSISTHNFGMILVLYQEKNEIIGGQKQKIRISAQYVFMAAIVALVIIWFTVDRMHRR